MAAEVPGPTAVEEGGCVIAGTMVSGLEALLRGRGLKKDEDGTA